MTTTGRDELIALRDLLTTSIDALLADPSLEIPSLKDASPGKGPVAAGPTLVATGAADQLVALLNGPAYTVTKALGGHVASSLRVAIEAHVVETIREAGGEGLHVNEIAKSSAVDPAKLARILRVLAAHHIFTETAYETFANNRCSTLLDTGKSVKDLKGNRFLYTDTNGFAALVAHCTEDLLKATGYLSEAVLSPETANSYEPEKTAFALAAGVDIAVWDLWAQPGNEHYLARFGVAMLGANALGGGLLDVVFQGGFDFADLKKDTLLVDVGGGAGAVSLKIAEAAPQIKIVLQDRPEVISGETKKTWEKENPSAIASGQVELVAHDFFTPQPIKEADVYLMRAIIHDWADPLAIKILSQLHDAASASSTLVLIEQVISPLSPSPDSKAPFPLLPSLGNTFPFLLDIQMLTGMNAQERTREQFVTLGEAAGWKLERVVSGPPPTLFSHLVFSKI
ncbi:O-methyltransferase [Leucosporidium creatinivorum]|uniref:O-methyltransferase n=1 Tax=Leucosporidium creatinivorum TaxID=106004 RepID=A0A1Y2E5Z8_9BASI|nr:O-methyltransferase [Leucosporidium creatinivorum]